jgi:hypothetical protein
MMGSPLKGAAAAAVLAAVSLVLVLARPPAWAGSTSPVLASGEVVARPVGTGALAEVTAIYGFDDIMQMNYPLTLVAYSGTSFVSFRPGAQANQGSFAGLNNGLAEGEIAAFEAAGSPTASAEIVRLEPAKVTVALPASLASGEVSFVAYVVLPDEGTFFTNVVTVTIAGGGA